MFSNGALFTNTVEICILTLYNLISLLFPCIYEGSIFFNVLIINCFQYGILQSIRRSSNTMQIGFQFTLGTD